VTEDLENPYNETVYKGEEQENINPGGGGQ
jgi:hypothetical protein